MDKIQKYLGENYDKDEFWNWLKEKKTVSCTIVEGGMLLAVCVGKVQIKGGAIKEFKIMGNKSEINFPYAAFMPSPVKIMGKDGWHLTVMRGALTYEVY